MFRTAGRVASKANDTSDTTDSDTWQFYLAGDGQENYAPFPATILSPTSGAAVDASNGLVLPYHGRAMILMKEIV